MNYIDWDKTIYIEDEVKQQKNDLIKILKNTKTVFTYTTSTLFK